MRQSLYRRVQKKVQLHKALDTSFRPETLPIRTFSQATEENRGYLPKEIEVLDGDVLGVTTQNFQQWNVVHLQSGRYLFPTPFSDESSAKRAALALQLKHGEALLQAETFEQLPNEVRATSRALLLGFQLKESDALKALDPKTAKIVKTTQRGAERGKSRKSKR